jgi:hypothetical protein
VHLDMRKSETSMRRYGYGHIEGGRMDPKDYP